MPRADKAPGLRYHACMGIPANRIIEAKTAIGKGSLAEPFLVSLYRVTAPYRGCGHGCRYCDGRAEKYYVEGDFERDISVRSNLPELAAREVSEGIAAKEFGAACIGSGVTDVYQPIERELGLTRRTLEALVPAQLPIVILTKNALILRDFDVLAQFPRVLVIVTVTTVNETHAALLEPGASTPDERLNVVARAKEAGFMSGIMAMPFCPGISDSAESVSALILAAEKARADFVYPGGLTLRPGRQKDAFLALVDESFPKLRPLYDELYRENRQSGMPLVQRSAPLAREWDRVLRERKMAQMIPHAVHRELLSSADSLFVLFCHMENLFSLRGVDTRPLHAAAERFAEWVKEERTALRRKRIAVAPSDPFPVSRILDEKFASLCETPYSLDRILANPKLSRLGCEVAHGTVFDYPSLASGRDAGMPQIKKTAP
jgi:DNA repair photolyase